MSGSPAPSLVRSTSPTTFIVTGSMTPFGPGTSPVIGASRNLTASLLISSHAGVEDAWAHAGLRLQALS